MKNSTFTGAYIYERIAKLKEQVSQINQAMNEILDEYGKDHTGYQILAESNQAKKSELNQLLNEKFESHIPQEMEF